MFGCSAAVLASGQTSPATTYKETWTFLVVLWLRIPLPLQGTWVRFLVQEDATCHRQLSLCATTIAARMLLLVKSPHLEPVLCNKRSQLKEKPTHHN